MNVKLFLIIIAATISSGLDAQLPAQRNIISGTVQSSDEGLGLPNSTVRALKNKVIITTGESGSFTLSVSKLPDTVLISHTGYHTKQIIIYKPVAGLMVLLEPSASTLEPVVVNTGYQKIKPNEVNGSVTVIDNKTLNQQTGINILDRLKNVTSGLSFNEGYSP